MSGTSRPPGFAAFPSARARQRPEPAPTDRLPSDTMTRRAIARSSASPQLAAGIRRVTGEVMHHVVAQRDLALRVPDRDIGVGTDLNRSLARTQIVDFCRRCSGQVQTCNERVTALPFVLGSGCEINTGAPIRRQFPHHPGHCRDPSGLQISQRRTHGTAIETAQIHRSFGRLRLPELAR